MVGLNVEQLLRMTAGAPEERRRLMVEVTETSAVADIEAADRRLAALDVRNGQLQHRQLARPASVLGGPDHDPAAPRRD